MTRSHQIASFNFQIWTAITCQKHKSRVERIDFFTSAKFSTLPLYSIFLLCVRLFMMTLACSEEFHRAIWANLIFQNSSLWLKFGAEMTKKVLQTFDSDSEPFSAFQKVSNILVKNLQPRNFITLTLSLHQSLSLYKLLEVLLNLSIVLTNLAKCRAIYTKWEIDAKIDSYQFNKLAKIWAIYIDW